MNSQLSYSLKKEDGILKQLKHQFFLCKLKAGFSHFFIFFVYKSVSLTGPETPCSNRNICFGPHPAPVPVWLLTSYKTKDNGLLQWL